MFDFFISHSSADKAGLADRLVDKLINMGYDIWYDKNEISYGNNIPDIIKNGLLHSYSLVMLITENFFKSDWVFYETGFFDSLSKNRIIPLIYDVSKEKIEKLLSMVGNRKYIDAKNLTIEEISTQLIQILNKIKQSNTDLKILEELQRIQKTFVSYEIAGSEIISLKLKEYLSLLENNKSFLLLSAKQIVKTVCKDILIHDGHFPCDVTTLNDSKSILDLIRKFNIGSLNVREYIEYILLQDVEQNSVDENVLNHALLNILVFYKHTKYPIEPTVSKIEVAYPEDLNYRDFEDMLEIDKKVLREDLIADVQTAYGWFNHNKYTHIAVRDVVTKKIVGYFSALPITDDTYTKILGGNFKDKDFTSEAIEQYIFPNFYRIYIAAVVIEPNYQNTGAFIVLYNALIDLFLFLAKDREIFISEVIAEASTKQGEKFCKMVGMKKISNTVNNTDIYKVVTIPPEFRLNNYKGKALYDLCYEKYQEFRDYFDKSH